MSTILNFGDLIINGQVIAYETPPKIEDGSNTLTPNPQFNGQIIYTTDISTNRSKITVTVRVSPETNAQFDEFANNQNNNTIQYRDKNYSNCVLEVKPERADQETVDYVFYGNPAV